MVCPPGHPTHDPLRRVRVVNEQSEGVDRRPHLREGHGGSLEADAPEPPHRRPLGVVRLVLDDEQVDGKRVLAVEARELRGGRLGEREVAALERLLELRVVASLDRHEHTFAWDGKLHCASTTTGAPKSARRRPALPAVSALVPFGPRRRKR